MFLQPGIDVPGLKQAAEGIKYGTVIDPHKFPDPKEQGRVKTRTLELHGPGSAGFIPDEDIPWSQNERDNSFGNQSEMSTFGLPQKNSMMKQRHHGNDKYSPLVSGAPYSTPGKISEWSSQGKADSGFNQKDHYGHKDPLGNVEHGDMKSKTKTIDWTQFSEVVFNLPKTTFNVKDTTHDRTKGPQEDGSSANIQGIAGGGQGGTPQGNTGPQVNGDVIWNVSGQHQSTIQKAVTENYNSTHTSNVQGAATFNHNDSSTHSVGQNYKRTVGQDTTVSGGKGRSDTYALAWGASAKNTAWSWLTSRDILGG
jgi:hypothetical protein